jgi:glycine/D-amino acid oxidase-like deaminating enzyme
MQADYLIIGQGICGTMLSWFLHREGKSFVVIDDGDEHSTSKVAAGIINPVTGRRYTYSWMIDEIMPFAESAYKEISAYLDAQFIRQRNVIDFFPSPKMRDNFLDTLVRNDTYLGTYPDQNHFNQFFNYDFGCGEINPAYVVNLQLLLASWRKKLLDLDSVLEEKFDTTQLNLEDDFVSYKDIHAHKVIFCDGIASMNNPWFSLLPFSPNKGEALIIESRELLHHHIFKKGTLLAPLAVEHTFWAGSNYSWDYKDTQPTQAFREQMTAHLQGWLKVPFKVLFHKAAVRPATVERRPFVGLHPHYPSIGILNGMGSKGTSLAPFFAHQLVQNLIHDLPITPEADVRRFNRTLSR